MSLPTLTSSTPIQLQFTSGQISVPLEDQDRFVAAAHRAVSASDHSVSGEQSSKFFFDRFLSPIRQWCESHRDRVESCYVPFKLSNDFVKVFVVRRQETFDLVLSDAISKLDGQLIDDGWRCDVLQVGHGPREKLSHRFDVDSSFHVF